MAERYFPATAMQKVLDRKLYMCIIIHIHYEASRESRRREALVPAGGRATVASGLGIAVFTARAVHSRPPVRPCGGGGACQLRAVGTDGKTTDVAVRSRGVGGGRPASGRAWPAVAGVDARGERALPGGAEERTGLGPSVSEKGE